MAAIAILKRINIQRAVTTATTGSPASILPYLRQRMHVLAAASNGLRTVTATFNCKFRLVPLHTDNEESLTQKNQRFYSSSLLTSTTAFGRQQKLIADSLTLLSPYSFYYGCEQQQLTFGTKSQAHSANKTDNKSTGKETTTTTTTTTTDDLFGEAAHLGLFAKFKHMYKKYWYVLLPVHVVTSCGWYIAFFYMSTSGVDIPSLLQYLPLSDKVIESVQGSGMGHYAIAYLCYKIATPLRYAVTLGGTTVSIKYLVQAGYIKPIPSKNEIMQIYEDKKAIRATAKAEKLARRNKQRQEEIAACLHMAPLKEHQKKPWKEATKTTAMKQTEEQRDDKKPVIKHEAQSGEQRHEILSTEFEKHQKAKIDITKAEKSVGKQKGQVANTVSEKQKEQDREIDKICNRYATPSTRKPK